MTQRQPPVPRTPSRAMSRTILFSLVFSGCNGCQENPYTGELGKSGICTVAVVNWTTDVPATSVVAYGPDEGYGHLSPGGEELVTEHSVLVAGLTPDATWHFQTQSVAEDGTELFGDDTTTTTCYPPVTVPPITPGVYEEESNGGQLLVNTVAYTSTVVLVNEDSVATWWADLSDEWLVAQARPTFDHLGVVMNIASGDHTRDIGEIKRIRLDKKEVMSTVTPLGHHDFLELEDGGYAYIKADSRDDLGVPVDMDECVATNGELPDGRHCVIGDALVEIATDGTELREVWNSWDNLPMTVTAETTSNFYPQGWDWIHGNGLFQTEDAYYLSSHSLSAVFKIDRATGNQVWQIGGEGGDFELLSGEAFFEQHSPRWVQESADEPGHLFVFNNRSNENRGDDKYSNVIEYVVDEEAMTWEQVWVYDRDKSAFSFVLGSVEPGANDHRLIGWGSGGAVEEVDIDGNTLRGFELGIGFPVGNVHTFEPLGGPLK